MREALFYITIVWLIWAAFNVILIAFTTRRAARHGIHVYVTGLWRPRIYVSPSVVDRLTPEELDAVIAHELGHVARGHLWVNLAIAIFAPFCRSAETAVRQELQADQFAVRLGKGAALASALRKLSTHQFDLRRAAMIEKTLSVTLKT